CRAANHRRTADVDILNRFGEGDAWFGNGRFEWIKVDHHQIDRLEPAFARFGFVFLVTTFVEKTAMHARMQSLYASFQHFRKRSEARDLAHWNFLFSQQVCRSAG